MTNDAAMNDSPNPSDEGLSGNNQLNEPFGEGKKILLVEDDPSTAELVRKLLTDRHFEVSLTEDGNAAWRTIESGFNPHLVICDFLMPEMNGFELFKKLKNNPETHHIPIIFLSARKNMADSLLASGVDAFFGKPLDTTALLKAAKKLAFKPLPQPAADADAPPSE